MDPHCKGCVHHVSAGHPKDSPLARTFNDWCTKVGRTARKAVGHCKNHGLRKPVEDTSKAPRNDP